MRLKLTIAYDGRPHLGWQSQPDGNTIQDLLQKAAATVAKEPIRIHGSGRTDAGVHAQGQVAHFDAPEHLTMNPFNWVPALNTKLPPSIRVLACEEVPNDFHARFSATEKTYRYQISTAPVLSPFRAGLAWHLPRQLDPAQLEAGLTLIEGEHDFEAFAALRGNETPDTSFVRTITNASFEPTSQGWQLRFTGNGFLYKMVRLLTGTLIHTAQGRASLTELESLIDQPAKLPHGRAPLCAPADGLYLESVAYSPK